MSFKEINDDEGEIISLLKPRERRFDVELAFASEHAFRPGSCLLELTGGDITIQMLKSSYFPLGW